MTTLHLPFAMSKMQACLTRDNVLMIVPEQTETVWNGNFGQHLPNFSNAFLIVSPITHTISELKLLLPAQYLNQDILYYTTNMDNINHVKWRKRILNVKANKDAFNHGFLPWISRCKIKNHGNGVNFAPFGTKNEYTLITGGDKTPFDIFIFDTKNDKYYQEFRLPNITEKCEVAEYGNPFSYEITVLTQWNTNHKLIPINLNDKCSNYLLIMNNTFEQTERKRYCFKMSVNCNMGQHKSNQEKVQFDIKIEDVSNALAMPECINKFSFVVIEDNLKSQNADRLEKNKNNNNSNNKYVITFGGDFVTDDIWILDVNNEKWYLCDAAKLPRKCYNTTALLSNDQEFVYVFGGDGASGKDDNFWVFKVSVLMQNVPCWKERRNINAKNDSYSRSKL